MMLILSQALLLSETGTLVTIMRMVALQQSTIRVVIVTSSLPEWNVCQRKAGGLDYFRRFLTACFVGGFCSIYGLLQALNVTANAFGHTSIDFTDSKDACSGVNLGSDTVTFHRLLLEARLPNCGEQS